MAERRRPNHSPDSNEESLVFEAVESIPEVDSLPEQVETPGPVLRFQEAHGRHAVCCMDRFVSGEWIWGDTPEEALVEWTRLYESGALDEVNPQADTIPQRDRHAREVQSVD